MNQSNPITQTNIQEMIQFLNEQSKNMPSFEAVEITAVEKTDELRPYPHGKSFLTYYEAVNYIWSLNPYELEEVKIVIFPKQVPQPQAIGMVWREE